MRPLLALLLLAPPLAAAPVPKALKKPPSPDGAWHLVAVNSDGKERSVEDMERYWLVRGETVTLGLPHTDPDRPPPPTTPSPACCTASNPPRTPSGTRSDRSSTRPPACW